MISRTGVRVGLTRRLALSVWLLVGAAGPAVAAGPDTFPHFWTRFRAAALAGDMRALQQMTKLPLEAGFDSDQDRPRRVSAVQFPAYMRTELRCQSAEGNSNIAMFRARPLADGRYAWHDAQRATVGAFAFEHGAAGWRLTTINYGDVTDYRARLKGRCDL